MEREHRTWKDIFVPLIAMIMLAFTGTAHADGNEMLGFIEVADGSDVIMAGVGLDTQPSGVINIFIPGGVTVQEVLLYWNGFALTNDKGSGNTDTIQVNGSNVTGNRIGGPDFFFNPAWSSTYRVGLNPNLLSTGLNQVTISGLDFGQADNGAGLLVIVDDGVNTTNIQVADGDDTAFSGFPSPRDAVVPVTYFFAPAGVDRMAEVTMFLASIEGPTSGSGPCRPNVLLIFVDGVLVDQIENPFNSNDGPEWDTYTTPVAIPAGATSVTVEPLSDNLGNVCPPVDPNTGLDASFVWVASAFVLQEGTGACCLSNGSCIDRVTAGECAAEGGIFQGPGTDCSTVDCTGACCLSDGTCIDGVTEFDCESQGGDFQGTGTDCGMVDCSGACCLSDGTCIDRVTQAECEFQGGVFQGSQSDCEMVDCSGACCLSDGTCIDGVTEIECASQGGEFQGSGTDCGTVDCSGACCLSDRTCANGLTEAECVAQGGYFQGGGTDCEMIDCAGACCLQTGRCIDGISEGECDIVGGVFQGAGTDCTMADCSGACCLADGQCIDGVDADECDQVGGVFQGPDTDCDSVNCFGACCLENGTCIDDVTEMDCASQGGNFQGTGTDCGTVDCSGACCLADGTCIDDVTEMECASQGGNFQGTGTDCGTVDCTGACCIPDGTCVDGLTEAQCAAQGGEFQGGGTDCDTVDCSGACCLDDGTCIDGVTELQCFVEGGTFQGGGTNCDTVDCSGACCIPIGPQGGCIDGLTEAECLNENGEFQGPGTDCETTECPTCDLTVDVEGCVVIPPPSGNDDCDGKVEELTLRYTGEDCSASNAPQEGQAECSGDPNFASPVRIRVSDKENPFDNGARVYFDGTVSLDSELNATASNAGENDFESNTYVHVLSLSNSVLQTNKFHTSCSKPLAVGNQFGAMLVTRMVTTNGGEVMLPPEDGECITEVVIETGDACDGKVTELLLEYTGEDCSATSNAQESADECSGDPSFASPVRIRVSDKEDPFDGGAEVYFDGDVMLGATFSATAANAGQNDFTSNSYAHILNQFDMVLQTVKFHTSCSKPLGPGDQFGSIFVAGMTTTEGGTDLFGAEVEYTYVVENTGSTVAENVTVIDSVFGELPGSPIASIDPGQTVELTLVTLIDQTTTNMVAVQGETAGGLGQCEDQASATVTVVAPPPSQDCCENGKPRALRFVYTGEGCSASDNTQDNDECAGDPGFASPVMIKVTNKSNPFDSNPDVYFSGEVALDGNFDPTAEAVGDDHFSSNTYIHIFSTSGSLLQTNEVHTSCSQPLFIGDQFGAALLTDCIGEDEPAGTTFPELAQCMGDLNGDGTRGFADLSTLLNVWGPCPAPCPADMDITGEVGFSDLTMMLQMWGQPCE